MKEWTSHSYPIYFIFDRRPGRYRTQSKFELGLQLSAPTLVTTHPTQKAYKHVWVSQIYMANVKHTLFYHIWVSDSQRNRKNQGITFYAYALLWEGLCLCLSDRIYNWVQNTSKYTLLNDMLIVPTQFIHYILNRINSSYLQQTLRSIEIVKKKR